MKNYTVKSWDVPRHVSVGTFRFSERMKELVLKVLASGRISYGEMSQEFEERFARLHGCQYAILSNSGTSSLQVALQAMMDIYGWEPGGQVIVPATTFIATANIVRHCRLVPVFVDVDPVTYNLDPEKLAEVVTRETRAVLPVHLFGQPANMSAIRQALPAYVKIIEDSCETMFVRHCGTPVGALGDIGCFSTYVAHLIVTGVGGLSTTNDPTFAAKMRSLVNHGLALEFLNPTENFAPQPMTGRRFKFDTYGYSYRITELEAALGLAQLENYGEMLALRARNARHLTAGLTLLNRFYDDPIQIASVAEGNEHAWMMYPIVLKRKPDGTLADKEPLMAHLNAWDIETRDMLPILGQPIYQYLNLSDFPVSEWLLRSGFYVGCHQDIDPLDMQYVVDRIADYFDVSRKQG